ncbi:MAG TPA: discoidin domain-containing protein [Myxococcota bacterium]|nr:discoidin domain-containing protein [Myxococcota bacterium]
MEQARARARRATRASVALGAVAIFGVAAAAGRAVEAPTAVEPELPPPSANERLAAEARAAPPGLYPRWLAGEQSYWTVVGAPDDEREAALSEDGALEVDKEAFTLEPFLWLEDAEGPAAGDEESDGTKRGEARLLTWRDARATQSLADGELPLPSVRWEAGDAVLEVRAFAAGAAGRSSLLASYTVENAGAVPLRGALLVALRPIQVLPAWQSLNLAPGFAPIYRIDADGGLVRVNGSKRVLLTTPPDGFGAAGAGDAPLVETLAHGRVPARATARDPEGHAGGALRYAFDLAPGAARTVHVEVPFYAGPGPEAPGSENGAARVEALRAETARAWRARLDAVALDLPSAADDVERAARSSLAWIEVHRDGPRLQPGSRNYERSWIRDGALTSAALLAFGREPLVRDFLRWYAPHQLAGGKTPCCIDARGADPTPEHDADGELVHAIALHHRFARDVATTRALWPNAVAAIGHLDALRRERTTDAYRAPALRRFYGILPESISHEGYAKRPVHSYWDSLFALRGITDAGWLAGVLGDEARAVEYTALRATFEADLLASYRATMEHFGLAHLPASADLGDFDPTATAVWLATGGDPEALPQPAHARTFDDYFEELDARRRGALVREAWAPYELRIVEAFVRLGRRERAEALLALALDDRRPRGWNQWPEIVWSDVRAPLFLGDLPHGWIASTFLHALRTLLVYERERDGALVVAAGVPWAWLATGEPLRAARLPTWWGRLDLELVAAQEPGGGGAAGSPSVSRLRVRLSGSAAPPGGIELAPPTRGVLRSVTVAGRPAPVSIPVRVDALPAEVELVFEAGP